MPTLKLNDTIVRNLKPTDKLVNYSFAGHKGLCLRVSPAGIKTFSMIFRSRVTGRLENIKIGRYPEVSLADAVDRVHAGWKDAAASKPVAFTEVKKNGSTVDEALALYAKRKLSAQRDGGYEVNRDIACMVTRHGWGALPIASLSKAMIRDALNHTVEQREAPQAALKSQSRISTWLTWAVKHDLIEFNPIPRGGLLDVRPGQPRTRVLDDAEIRKLWRACQSPGTYRLSPSFARVLQLILTTGARSGMVCGMADAELDLQGARGALWDVPAGRMKMGKAFACPLNDLAVSLIRSGERVALNPRGLANAVVNLCETLAMVPWTPHDLRRTASKRLRQAGYTRNQVGAFLAHEAEGDATMRHYDPEDRWDDFAIKREMSDRLAVIIREIVGGVVELRSVA